MRSVAILMLVGTIFTPLTIRAESVNFPIFDPNSFCKAVGENNPQYPNGLAEKACLSNEQQAYFGARQLWPLATDQTKRKCADMASKPGTRDHVAYEALEHCLSLLIPQDQLQAQGAFHY